MHSTSIRESAMIKRISQSLKEDQIMVARLHFIISTANLFKPFLVKFQLETTLIHLLYEELSQLLQLLLHRFLKEEVLSDKSGSELLSVPIETRHPEACDFGMKTNEVLRKLMRDKNPRLASFIKIWCNS